MTHHECKALTYSDSVAIMKDTWTKRWEMVIDFVCYGDEQRTSYLSNRAEIPDIAFCPYCGERLED